MGGFLNSLTGGEQGLANTPPGQQALTGNIAAAQQGVTSNIANQNAFAQALQTQMQGGGPNLAGSLLSNATGQNVQNTAALMAGQRGTGSNAGLIAREAAQQGAGIQQNAIGQAAAQRAQQQLAAQSGLAQTYGTIGSEQAQNLATNQQALTGQNQQTVQTNQTNATIGANNAAANNAAVSGLGQGLTSGASSISSLAAMLAKGGKIQKFSNNPDLVSYDQDNKDDVFAPGATENAVPNLANMDTVNASNSDQINTDVGGTPDAGLKPTPQAPAAAPGASKPLPPKAVDTQNLSQAPEITQISNPINTQGFSSQLPDHLQAIADIYHPHMMATGGNVNQPSYDASKNAYAKGGKIDALVSPGEKFLKPKEVKEVAKGKNPMSVGETIPGKAKVPGPVDSYDNDTVPKKLDVGGVVLPRSVTQSKDANRKATEFVIAIINKQKKKK